MPFSFHTVWKKRSELNLHNHDLRQDPQEYFIHISRLHRYKNFPLYSYSRIWNDLDQFLKNIEVRNIFDNAIKVKFLLKLSDTVNCKRLYCPSCYND